MDKGILKISMQYVVQIQVEIWLQSCGDASPQLIMNNHIQCHGLI